MKTEQLTTLLLPEGKNMKSLKTLLAQAGMPLSRTSERCYKKVPNFKIIDTVGEKSAIITSVISPSQKPAIACSIMEINQSIEQVGFLDQSKALPTFTMMGEELSLNGTFAAGYILLNMAKQNKTQLFLAGPNITVTATKDNGSIALNIPRAIIKTQDDAKLKFAGMTYQIMSSTPPLDPIATKTQKSQLNMLTQDSPAAGLIYSRGNTIFPLIFVKATNSYVWEQACGSGSLAFALARNLRQVRQPSGKSIQFIFNNNTIHMSLALQDCKEL